jgi:hypothetical protein
MVPEATPDLSLLALARAMPALTVLGLYGFWCAIHDTLAGGREGSRAALPVVWICVAVLALRLVPTGAASLLFLAVPLLFLASRSIFELLQREIRDSRVLALMMCSGVLFVYARSTALQSLPTWLGDFAAVSPQDKLRLHFGVDGLLFVIALLAVLYRLTAKRDFYRRLYFASFVILVIVHGGVSALAFNTARVRRTDPWLEMYRVLKTKGPYDQIIIVGAESPQPALLYATGVLFPAVAHSQTPSVQELDKLLAVIAGNPLVVVIDPSQKLLHRTRFVVGDRTINLSPVYDSEQLTAYAPDKT